MKIPKSVSIFEVCPRDGLQPEPVFIPTEKKIELVNRLTDAGCTRIEATSFVHPKWVPQMADARAVLAGIRRKPGVTYSALIPNMRGLELAIEAKLDEVVTIVSTSESHNRKNLNCAPEETLRQIEEINRVARQNNVRVRSYIATVFGCPIEGAMPPEKALEFALALESFGAYEVSLGDTTGMASPIQAFEIPLMIKAKLTRASLAVHYHQHEGIEHACNLASLQAGIRVFDGAAGGLGGCPYAPGATGNARTETIVDMFHRMGIDTGIDAAKLRTAGDFAQTLSTLLHMHPETE
ncbi:MAG: hydroxymethylglutaryl-CoA lyase [Clostridiaceae bacterium]|nr:hydroxymethylglutaryl-CoA lyase [Clostridiaceae bacterium]